MANEENAGALWNKKSGKGTSFMSGYLTINGTKHPIVVFVNKFKKTDKHPDFQIYLSDKKEVEAPF